MGEFKTQRNFNYAIGASLATTPFLGPIGILGAGAIAITKFYRFTIDGVTEEYESEKKAYKEKKKITKKKKNQNNKNLYTCHPESPETAIARGLPSGMARVLNQDNERKRYNEGLAIGSGVVKDYLVKLSQREYDRVSKIEIFPEQQNKFMGLPVGRKSLEIKINK